MVRRKKSFYKPDRKKEIKCFPPLVDKKIRPFEGLFSTAEYVSFVSRGLSTLTELSPSSNSSTSRLQSGVGVKLQNNKLEQSKVKTGKNAFMSASQLLTTFLQVIPLTSKLRKWVNLCPPPEVGLTANGRSPPVKSLTSGVVR
jgi:hypothetical protein